MAADHLEPSTNPPTNMEERRLSQATFESKFAAGRWRAESTRRWLQWH